MALVDSDDVSGWLQRPVDPATADRAIRVAEAWVQPLVRSVSWPPSRDAHPDLWAAVVELAGIAVDNPTGMRSSTIGGQTDEWSVARRAEILTELAGRYGGATTPLGSFPTPQPWPEPADRSSLWPR